MKLTYDEKEALKKHERVVGHIESIYSGQPDFGEEMIKSLREYVVVLLPEFGLGELRDKLEVSIFDFYGAVRDYKSEVTFVLEEKKKRFDPSWKHHLMQKKISDMTGYEYKTYLELIGDVKA